MSAIDITKVRGTRNGQTVRGLRVANNLIYGERQVGTDLWVTDTWRLKGSWDTGGIETCPLDLIESPVAAEPAAPFPHTITAGGPNYVPQSIEDLPPEQRRAILAANHKRLEGEGYVFEPRS